MNRPLDPDAPDSIALSLRITRPLAAALDAELARFTAQNPGVSASRALVARIALMRVFLPSGTVLASASAPAPEAPVEPAPAARAEHAARPPRVAPVPVSPPAVDPRQLPLTPTASAAPMSESAHPHESLRARYTDARERLRFTHDDATRALATAGVPVENLRRELVKPTDQWTAAHAAALAVWLDTIEANGAPAASEPAAAPRRARGKAVATPENDALRARYTAALAAKLLTNKPTAKRVGCSEATLHQWQVGTLKNLGGDKDRDGKWLANLTSILEGVEPLT